MIPFLFYIFYPIFLSLSLSKTNIKNIETRSLPTIAYRLPTARSPKKIVPPYCAITLMSPHSSRALAPLAATPEQSRQHTHHRPDAPQNGSQVQPGRQLCTRLPPGRSLSSDRTSSHQPCLDPFAPGRTKRSRLRASPDNVISETLAQSAFWKKRSSCTQFDCGASDRGSLPIHPQRSETARFNVSPSTSETSDVADHTFARAEALGLAWRPGKLPLAAKTRTATSTHHQVIPPGVPQSSRTIALDDCQNS